MGLWQSSRKCLTLVNSHINTGVYLLTTRDGIKDQSTEILPTIDSGNIMTNWNSKKPPKTPNPWKQWEHDSNSELQGRSMRDWYKEKGGSEGVNSLGTSGFETCHLAKTQETKTSCAAQNFLVVRGPKVKTFYFASKHLWSTIRPLHVSPYNTHWVMPWK